MKQRTAHIPRCCCCCCWNLARSSSMLTSTSVTSSTTCSASFSDAPPGAAGLVLFVFSCGEVSIGVAGAGSSFDKA
jgi:hypothetical protein